MKRIMLILCGSGVFLSGCSGSSKSNKDDDLYYDNSTMSKVKNLFRSTKNITTKEMNVSTLMVSTFGGNLSIPVERLIAYSSASDEKREYIRTLIDDAVDADAFSRSLPEYKKDLLAQESEIPSLESVSKVIYERSVKAINAAKSGNDDEYLWGFQIGDIIGKSVIGEANRGCSGWYSGLNNKVGMKSEMYAIAEITYIANAIETKIADSMVDKTFYSEEDAKKYIRSYFGSMTGYELYSIVRSAQDEYVDGGFSADLTDVNEIKFTVNGNGFACTNDGILWHKNNSDWFGSGNLSGKKYITKVEYADGAEMAKIYKMELNNSTSTSHNIRKDQ